MKKYGVMALVGAFALSANAKAGIIDSWNVDNVLTDSGPCVDFTT